jgi:hypothetical protein
MSDPKTPTTKEEHRERARAAIAAFLKRTRSPHRTVPRVQERPR